MGERILAKGHSPTVFDIDRGALDRIVQRGARQAHSAGAAVSDITITLLPSSVEVRQAVLGENGVLSYLRPASTVIDLSGTDGDFPERSGTNGYLFARAVDAEGFQDRDHPIRDGE
jgi:3-hydroxyisobutyrate dehydrogenase-like beta-hydroxyacid dehydrogenase